MRPISKLLLSAGALAVCLAPALQAELSGAHLQTHPDAPTTRTDPGATQHEMLPYGSGLGAGFWIAPTRSAGFASAQLYDELGRVRYTMRANLLPAAAGLPGMDQQGGFLGVLFLVDRLGNKTKAAQISGKWIRHPDGVGEFGVDMMVPTTDRDLPLVSVGQIEGTLLPPGIMPAVGFERFPRENVPAAAFEPFDDQDEPGPAAVGQLVLQWVIPEA